MHGLHLLSFVALAALFCFSVVRSSRIVIEDVPMTFVPRSETAGSTSPPKVFLPIERTPDDNRFLTADLVARARGKAVSDRFDSPLVRSRVNIDERQRMLSKVIGVRVNIRPFQEGNPIPNQTRRIILSRTFVLHPPFQRIIYFSENDNRHYRVSLAPFFYSVAPAHYDAQIPHGIPVDQVDIVRLDSVPLWFDVGVDMQRDARAMRERVIRRCFLPISHRLSTIATNEAMISYRLQLPTDVPLHPSTFSHPLLDLGDVVKMILIYCTRQGASFSDFLKRVMPFASIVPVVSDHIVNGRHVYRKYSEDPSGDDENSSGCFIQALLAQMFRLIKPQTPFACLQECSALALKDAPWPSLRTLAVVVPTILFARHHNFVSNPNEQSIVGHMMAFNELETASEKVIAESLRIAKEVWIDVDIPASTPDPLKLLQSVVALRRLSAVFNYDGPTSE